MTHIFSVTGFSGAASSQGNRASPQGQKDASRQIIDQIAASDPAKAQKLEEKLSSLQQTIAQMQKSRQDLNAARKEAAKQKLARIKAEMQALKMMMGGNPEANARKLARLAREMASAARDYKSAGGADGGGGISVNPVSGIDAAEKAAAGADETTQETAQAAAQPALDKDQPPNAAVSRSSEDEDFVKELRKLRRELKDMVEKEKIRMAQEKGKSASADTRAADNALQDVARHAAAIETPMMSIDIKI